MNGCGLRVMFDLGAKADGTSDRVFKIHNGKKDGLEWDFKDHIIIGMNGAAAGSNAGPSSSMLDLEMGSLSWSTWCPSRT